MNNKIFSLIAGVLTVILFWIGWVSLNPSDKKAMAQFVSVEKLVNDEISSRNFVVMNKSIFAAQQFYSVSLNHHQHILGDFDKSHKIIVPKKTNFFRKIFPAIKKL